MHVADACTAKRIAGFAVRAATPLDAGLLGVVEQIGKASDAPLYERRTPNFSLWWSLIRQPRCKGEEMAKKATKIRPWTKEDVRMLKALAREQTKTTVIARKLKRSVGALHQKAMRTGVTLGARRKKKRA